jgi:hypothetical protein
MDCRTMIADGWFLKCVRGAVAHFQAYIHNQKSTIIDRKSRLAG